MKYLLDTHVFLWWITDSEQLSDTARQIITAGENTLQLSAASGWEIAIKARLGRLEISGAPAKIIPVQLSANAIESLPIQMSHALHFYTLPPLHRDPFDRMLVAQSQLEALPILTADALISQYDVETIW